MTIIYEVIPLKGVGPVLLGMSREEVHSVMGLPEKSFRLFADDPNLTDAYHESGFQVFYDKDDRVEHIELLSLDDSFVAIYKGKDVFRTRADELVAFISQDAPFDPEYPEPGCLYVFPQLELSLWRPFLPEDESDPEGQYFSGIAIGKQGYWSSTRGIGGRLVRTE